MLIQYIYRIFANTRTPSKHNITTFTTINEYSTYKKPYIVIIIALDILKIIVPTCKSFVVFLFLWNGNISNPRTEKKEGLTFAGVSVARQRPPLGI